MTRSATARQLRQVSSRRWRQGANDSPGGAVRDLGIGRNREHSVVRLRKVVPATSAEVWVKLENCNPTGSHKDASACAMIEAAETRGQLRRA
jgi:predicted alternative tryptophan synthase beta-subunit